jgi:lysophospholipase L1-like esterase
MRQIFIFGESYAYGVGDTDSGWANRLKVSMHEKMYAPDGTGETVQIYNFGKPGATVDFLLSTMPFILSEYAQEDSTVLISIGANDSRAQDHPDSFVSDPEIFRENLSKLIKSIKGKAENIIFLCYPAHDESKTLPKHNPLTGGKSYFFESRLQEYFNEVKAVCEEQGIDVLDIQHHQWKSTCLYDDGLHPNDKGHKIIFEAVKKKLEL